MAGIRKTMNLGIRKAALPLIEIIQIKNKIVLASTNQHGYLR